MATTIIVQRAERPAEDLGGGARRTGRVYADFVVDGAALSRRAQARADLISCLGWGTRAGQDAVVAMLLLERPCEALEGRVPIYVCPECGDIYCGAVTAVIERLGDTVVWRNFGFETGLDIDPPVLDQANLADLGPFEFPWAMYENAIRQGYGLGGFLEVPRRRSALRRFFGIK